ncbi:unnamed protein product [Urochloa humidicola]
MAELAIEISKTAVEALVNKVKSAIKEEAEKWQIVERDIVFIKDEFEMMQSFLNTASGERMMNQVARTWVTQVRDLSYDTEDCIEFVLHLNTKRPFWQRLLRSKMVQTQLRLDQAVAEIKQLKARAEQVNLRNMRYNLIGNYGEQVQQTSAASQRTLDIFIKPRHAFDMQNGILDLTSLIKTDDKGLQVISVCGTGGDLGTVSIIKKAYDDQEICRMFECRAWVKLTHPFNPHEFIRSLLAGFYANSLSKEKEADDIHSAESSSTWWDLGKRISSHLTFAKFAKMLVHNQDVCAKVLATMKATEDSILKDFMERIRKKTCLIILEDLFSIVDWNCIMTLMPDMTNKSRIVVSTRQLEIACLCAGQQKVLLQRFSKDHCVYAFFKDLPKNPQGSERKKCKKMDIRGLPGDKLAEHWREVHNLLGRESELMKLQGQLSIAHQRRAGTVISLWGMAGVGKSFLVGALYDHFADTFDGCAVVSAARPFDIKNLCQNLVNDLKAVEGEDIFLRCWKHLEENWCLVVIDGLRSNEDWDLIEGNLISGASRSCFIVITGEESVARHCAKSDDAVCCVQGLEADAARDLFEKETEKIEKQGEPLGGILT